MNSSIHHYKILIGTPIHEGSKYCLEEFLDNINKLNFKNFDLLLVDNSNSNEFYENIKKKDIPIIKDYISKNNDSPMLKVVNSRNIIIEEFKKGDYTHLLFVDSDVILPPNTITKLLNHNKDIISGTYYSFLEVNGIRNYYPLLMTACDKEGNIIQNTEPDCLIRYFYRDEIENEKLIEVEAIGLGCALIAKKVLKNFKFSYKKKGNATDDMDFCIETKKQGYKIYADVELKCQHLIEDKNRINWE